MKVYLKSVKWPLTVRIDLLMLKTRICDIYESCLTQKIVYYKVWWFLKLKSMNNRLKAAEQNKGNSTKYQTYFTAIIICCLQIQVDGRFLLWVYSHEGIQSDDNLIYSFFVEVCIFYVVV